MKIVYVFYMLFRRNKWMDVTAMLVELGLPSFDTVHGSA